MISRKLLVHRNISYEMVFDKIERVFLSSFEHSYMPHTKEFIIMEENKFRSYHTHTHTHKKKLDYFSYLDIAMTQSLTFWTFNVILKIWPNKKIWPNLCHFEPSMSFWRSKLCLSVSRRKWSGKYSSNGMSFILELYAP